MQKCKIEGYTYIPSESFTEQGTWNKVKKYEKKGYNVRPLGKGNGNWLITKPAQAIIFIQDDNEITNENLANEITDFYGRDNISESIVKTFLKEEAEGLVGLYYSEGYYTIKKYDVLEIVDYS